MVLSTSLSKSYRDVSNNQVQVIEKGMGITLSHSAARLSGRQLIAANCAIASLDGPMLASRKIASYISFRSEVVCATGIIKWTYVRSVEICEACD